MNPNFSLTSTDSPSHKTAAERYERAFRALCQNAIDEYAAGIDEETSEYLRVNRAMPGARRGVPRWRRWRINRRVIRELDYWERTGQVLATRPTRRRLRRFRRRSWDAVHLMYVELPRELARIARQSLTGGGR